MTTPQKKNRRVLFGDHAPAKYQRVQEMLKEHGVDTDCADDLVATIEKLSKNVLNSVL